MSTRPKPARIILAEALKNLREHKDHSFIVGKIAAAFKQAYPTFNVETFLRQSGVK
jgi:hypothetical protein